MEEDDGDPWTIDIPETEGYCKVWGPSIEDPDIIAPLKTKQVNIDIEVELMIGRQLGDRLAQMKWENVLGGPRVLIHGGLWFFTSKTCD